MNHDTIEFNNKTHLAMKTVFSIILAATFFLTSYAQSNSDVTRFFKNGGASMISTLAHPTNTFKSASWEFYDHIVTIEIVSEDNFFGGDVYTTVSFSREGYFFTGIRIDNDSDLVPPFTAIAILKEMLNELIQEYNTEQGEMIGAFERYFNRGLTEMNAYQVSLIYLSVAFLSS